MGVATGNPNSNISSSIPGNESASTTQLANDQEQTSSLLVSDQTQSSDYFAYLARATNDAVRDWDVTSGKLRWRQGLLALFGYDSQSARASIAFWDDCLHPGDQVRIKGSIGEALSSDTTQWSGEYRFRCHDGNY